MMWVEIKKDEVDKWNGRLKETDASFFQYPYYAEGYKYFLMSKAIHIVLTAQGKEKAFCTLLRVGYGIFKIGLIIRGPVILDNAFSNEIIIHTLKQYAIDQKYIFIRVNPNDFETNELLESDKDFVKKDYFPFYKGSQPFNLNKFNLPQDQLFKSFKKMCQRKIIYSEQIDYAYSVAQSEYDLKEVYDLFRELGKKKKFTYRPFPSYKAIFKSGLKHQLCEVYIARYEGRINCAAFIVKDKLSFNYLSGALVLDNGINPKNSPSSKLHYLAMMDCFYKEHKRYYNMSYSDPLSDVFFFKNSFAPILDEKPGYYTFPINKILCKLFVSVDFKKIRRTKRYMRTITHLKFWKKI